VASGDFRNPKNVAIINDGADSRQT
jgi:hypothetical protein